MNTPSHSRGVRRTLAGGTAAALLTLALAACSGGLGGSDAGGGGEAATPAEAGAADKADVTDSKSMSLQRDAAAATPANAPGAARPAPQTQLLIKTGTVSLSSRDLDQLQFDVDKIITSHDGLVANSKTSTDDEGSIEYARLTVRVPAEDFEETMDELEKVGNLQSSSSRSKDVTTDMIDVQARIRAQQASLDRLETLLAQAGNLRTILTIENQVTQRQADLDSLKQQRAWLSDQSSLSTITVFLEKTSAKQKPEKDHNSFVAGLLGGWDALKGFGAVVATVVGALLPFLVVLAILGIPVWVLVRRLLRHRPAPAPAPAPAGGTDGS